MEQSNLKNVVHVLIIDDDEEDFLIIDRLFKSMKSILVEVEWVGSSDEGIAIINEARHDAYFVDYRIDARTGLDILQEVDAIKRSQPFILLTGVGDEEIERESLQLAASDYLVKSQLKSDSLARTLYYALGRKEQEQQKIDQLIEINALKDEFISIASHQLRTPATTVKQYVAMTLDGMAGEVSEKQRNFLQKAYDSNERQLAIINDLLKVAQVDAGKFELNEKRINLTALVREAVNDIKPLYQERTQQLEFHQKEPLYVHVDPSAIRMVIDNLLENASKYSESDSLVHVSCQQISDESIELRVADSGVGVADPERLFKKFSRIENKLSTEVGGTGLGLYWARSIAQLHDGDLRYEANDPSGSIFVLEVPIA